MCLLVDRYPQTKGPMTKKFVEAQKIVKTPNTIGRIVEQREQDKCSWIQTSLTGLNTIYGMYLSAIKNP